MKKLITLSLAIFLFSCEGKKKADLIIHNATVYTVNDTFEVASAFAIRDGKFLAAGSDEEILGSYEAQEVTDLNKAPVYPGFIDAHAHFFNYGVGLRNADLVGTQSFDEILSILQEHRKKYPEAAWLIGRGWDQNDWEIKEFPTKDKLDELFPDLPVLLTRVDGHAALVNSAAMRQSEVFHKTREVEGGKIYFDENGEPTGLLVDNAIWMIEKHVPGETHEEKIEALLRAQENCFTVGLTTVNDAGLGISAIQMIDSMHQTGDLKMRIYAMISPYKSSIEYFKKHGIMKTDYLSARSFKVYGDGALGSRGAALIKDYADDHGNAGFLLESPETYESLAKMIYEMGFQMNTHCIGDLANKTILDLYGKYLGENNDRRWRIEHAQVVSQEDISKFGKYNIIPSVQPTHATSDMYWAKDRLGEPRVKTAYAFKDLLDQNGYIALGSDFPVEHINPMYGFHAAVARQDADHWPEEGWQTENKLSREEALKGMTIWAAYSNFEENEKGSIEPGKFADFVIMQKDIMKVPETELRNLKVNATYIAGEKVY